MKVKIFIVILGILSFSTSAKAQRGIRIAYIDMDYILENVPEYKEASALLDTKVGKWKSEIETKLRNVDEMNAQLDNERALLTKELIEERDEEIAFEREQILEYQQKRFGPGGDLSIQRRQLVQPVQDQVFNAVQEISTARKYDLVFDKSSELMLLYTADRLDISDQVLRSITRASKRTQLNSKKDEKIFDIDEAKTFDEDRATQERQSKIENKKSEREAALEERAKKRASEKEERQKAFEERRRKLLEARERRKDSIADARANKETRSSLPEPLSVNKTSKEDAVQARQRQKDSIIAARTRKRDSILAARKKKVTPSGSDDGDND
ncbi:OmpH family outer membrane protein [Dokdonia sp. Hel_I_53]|uniref:OmpH family outer membrane protein n=1 Tax=Dokdonia sp. Hel_I_53 TaxID=1566287 RepID=UPI00119C6B48|nr:OmpH family outer membrane protein [Dokdonia sp. Hel_I_53]TVZ52358.1 periplasmic chaperone for outer membrane proteins Skp [Dokdonia sp. Hel_I_53]